MNKTKIEWTQYSWNPVTGCLNDCRYCYARQIVKRFATGNGGGKPLVYKSPDAGPYPAGFDPTFHTYRLGSPKNAQKPGRIFVCSMADLFGPWIPQEWINKVMESCLSNPVHQYLFLTKNTDRYVAMDRCDLLQIADNMWYGTTVTGEGGSLFISDRHHTFVSIEPLLADIPKVEVEIKVDWMIIGAESGNRKDKVVPKLGWIENICNQADKNNIPVFMKDSLIPIVGPDAMRREYPEGML